jgi:hypothetical protein
MARHAAGVPREVAVSDDFGAARFAALIIRYWCLPKAPEGKAVPAAVAAPAELARALDKPGQTDCRGHNGVGSS